jgi:phage terminase large subunit
VTENFTVAAQRIAAWRKDAVLFVREVFGVEPDAWQVDALTAYSAGKPRIRLGMQACAGPGKSAVLAWIGWHALLCHADKQRHPNGYATSITDDNLKDGLWKEFAVWHQRSPLLLAAFTWQKERIFAKNHPETWFLSKRTFSKSADLEAQGRTLSGAHAPYIFYLIDESGEMPPSVLRAAEQGLSNCEWGCIATAYNPTSHTGIGYQVSNDQSHLWDVIRVTGDPNDPKRSTRIDLEWARAQIALYGRENPWVMAYILGQFPPSAINALLAPDDVRTAMERKLGDHVYAHVAPRLGVDVARFGDDRTVLFPRQGRRAYEPVILRNADTLTIAGRVIVEKERWESEHELIDNSGGWAAGVIDQCKIGGYFLYPVDSSAQATDPRYFNRRSEVHFLAAEWVKSGGWLPNLPELVREATAATYWFEGGRLRVEDKAQIKKRLGNSPDLWDAFVYSFALPDMPKRSAELGRPFNRGRAPAMSAVEYNPLAELGV